MSDAKTTSTFLNVGERKSKSTGPASSNKPQRPGFSSTITSDRLRESERMPSSPTGGRAKSMGPYGGGQGRKSVFREIGLDEYEIANATGLSSMRSSTTSLTSAKDQSVTSDSATSSKEKRRSWLHKLANKPRPMIKTSASTPPATFTSFTRVAMISLLIAVVIPGYRNIGREGDIPADGVGAGVIGRRAESKFQPLETRADTPTDICTRWSHQSAIVNGTVYVYGGQAKTSASQTSNTWNNNFLSLDLTKTWSISNPALSGLAQPSGPPAVANGYLWNTFTSLFLYGGLFSDTPPATPAPLSTWEYSLITNQWYEHQSPTTSAGNHSDPAGVPVQRSAEGAGLSVPELGLSWYFGGHEDMYTTPGWSNQIARIYLRSMLEFTHPGYLNDGVQTLGAGTKGAPDGGAYRNITQGGVQDTAGFPERADGVLVYVPGWGTKGILLGLSGGQEQQTFTELNVIDVYDIASSTWYKQPTSGTTPTIRVNPCAVVFAAPDGSSFNVHMYGGQNLQPYKGQTQYTDLWILSIPSFTWIKADLTGQSEPPARAGHTCHAWDGQMVVIGGYVGTQISCDSPGIYVFNASSLKWQNSFVALSGGNAMNQQPAQATTLPNGQNNQGVNPARVGLSGSYGYLVPPAVQSVIGGNAYGSATLTTPAAGTPTAGPMATGQAPIVSVVQSVFTTTQSGSVVVQTTQATQTAVGGSSGSSVSSSNSSSGPNIGAIVAGVIAGLLAVLAGYLAFCTWLYRRQLTLYKNHVAMSQRAALGSNPSPDNRFRPSAEKAGAGGPLLGAFGTEIAPVTSAAGSRGRDSHSTGGGRGSESLSGSGGSNPTPGLSSGPSAGGTRYQSQQTSGEPTPMEMGFDPVPVGAGAGGGKAAAGANPQGWSRLSDRGSMSSTDDLLGGQEPSFFSVVLSPRRTLRVINRD